MNLNNISLLIPWWKDNRLAHLFIVLGLVQSGAKFRKFKLKNKTLDLKSQWEHDMWPSHFSCLFFTFSTCLICSLLCVQLLVHQLQALDVLGFVLGFRKPKCNPRWTIRCYSNLILPWPKYKAQALFFSAQIQDLN